MKKIDQTLAELWVGEILFGILCQIPGAILVHDKAGFSIGLWAGVLLAGACSFHMWWVLQRAMDMAEQDAGKMAGTQYLLRYLAVILLVLGAYFSGRINAFAAFLGYMSMKGGAYLTPFVHKGYNRITGHTDPIPRSLEEIERENASNDQTVENDNKYDIAE